MRILWLLALGLVLSILSLNLHNKLGLTVIDSEFSIPEPPVDIKKIQNKYTTNTQLEKL